MEAYKKRKLLEVITKYKDDKAAIVVTGFRRVGKTTMMRQVFETLPTANKIFLDLESPINQKIFEEKNYDHIYKSIQRLGLSPTSRPFVFLDEIQRVKNTPSVVKYLSDHYQIKFYLTGSSSFYLKNHFSESLAGRKFLFEMFPLDFEEFLWFKDKVLTDADDFDSLAGFYEEFLAYGGFPEVVLAADNTRKQLALDDILGSYFSLDVTALSHFRDNRNLRELILLLTSRVGSKADIAKLAASLGVSRETVYSYLDFLEQTYFLHMLPAFSGSSDAAVRHLPKVYFGDTGLLNRLGQVALGQAFENAVFNQLLPRLGETRRINYYQHPRSKSEIDFIVDAQTAYELKVTAGPGDVNKLQSLAGRLGLNNYSVISLRKVLKPKDGLRYPYRLP